MAKSKVKPLNQAKNISTFDNWCQTTSCHGFSDLSKARHWMLRLFWVSFITLFLTMAAWQISELLYFFFTPPYYHTTTHIENYGQLRFPKLTLCNLNKVDRQKALQLGMTMANNSNEVDVDYLSHLFGHFNRKAIIN